MMAARRPGWLPLWMPRILLPVWWALLICLSLIKAALEAALLILKAARWLFFPKSRMKERADKKPKAERNIRR